MNNIYETVNGNEQYYEYSTHSPVEVDGDSDDLLSFVLEREQLAKLTSGDTGVEHFNGGKMHKKNNLLHTVMMAIVVAVVILFIYMAFSSCDHSLNNRSSLRVLSPELGHDYRAIFSH